MIIRQVQLKQQISTTRDVTRACHNHYCYQSSTERRLNLGLRDILAIFTISNIFITEISGLLLCPLLIIVLYATHHKYSDSKH